MTTKEAEAMITQTYLLVGVHYNKPAKTLLAALDQDQEVELRREPENPYDSNAVSVWVETSEINASLLEELNDDLEACGCTLREVWAAPAWKLGHVGATGGKPLEKARRDSGLNLRGNLDLLMEASKEGKQEQALPRARLHQGSDGLLTLRVEQNEGEVS